VGTILTARRRGQPHTAVIVEAKDRPAGRAVKYGDQLFASLSAAAKAVTGHPTDGWLSLGDEALMSDNRAPIRRFFPNISQARPHIA
jgi:hypothetical protein